MSPRKTAKMVLVSDSDACTGTDEVARDGLRETGGNLVTRYPATPGAPDPPRVAHAHLPQWRDRPGPGA